MKFLQKKYYQKTRIPSRFVESMISIDGNTAQFITISFLLLLFLLVTIGVITGTSFEKIWSPSGSENTAPIVSHQKIKGNAKPFEITLIEALEKQTIAEAPQPKETSQKAEISSNELANQPEFSKYEKPDLPSKNSPKRQTTEARKPEITQETVLNQDSNIERKTTETLSSGSSSEFAIQSKSSDVESEESKKFSRVLEPQIFEKISVLKPHITGKWKHIRSSYIITLDIEAGKPPQITFVTKSANFYFNIIVERAFNDLEIPSLESANLKEFSKTYIITYRP